MGKKSKSLRDIARSLVEPKVVYRRPALEPTAVIKEGQRIDMTEAQRLMAREMNEPGQAAREITDAEVDAALVAFHAAVSGNLWDDMKDALLAAARVRGGVASHPSDAAPRSGD